MKNNKLIYQSVQEEQFQGHATRQKLYEKLEKEIKIPVISFFTSFIYPVSIEDNDANMLEGVLQKSDLSKGLMLFLSSPGGDALAAERIINLCRGYSETGKYQVIVPSKAKSAATMICLGAEKLIMSKSSELGSIDPQVIYQENGQTKRSSIYNLTESYKRLFSEAINTKGNLQPYIQQLSHYDTREIEEMKMVSALSEDIALKALHSGMLTELNKEDIEKKIEIFLIPEKEVKTHGRAIYALSAQNCGLNVEMVDPRSILWKITYELFVRLNNFVSTNNVAKCIESKDYSFHTSISVST